MGGIMKVFRIYTESTGHMRANAISAVSEDFESFTVIDCEGYWEDARESSIIIEIIADDNYTTSLTVKAAARRIRDANYQQCVLVTAADVDGTFV